MKTYALLFTLFTLIATSVDAAETTFGNGVHLNETNAISAILDNPDAYIGKTVKISGMILEVCARRGCWIYVAGDREGEKALPAEVHG